jgi:FkbM family methyltransferase
MNMHKGLYYRENTLDRSVINEGYKFPYKNFAEKVKDKVVIDIGAFIGDTAYVFLNNGAKQVISFECCIENISMIKIQPFINDSRFTLIEKGVGGNNTSTTLYVNDSATGQGAHSIKPRKKGNFHTQPIEIISFSEIIKTYNPDCLKIDCEGAEADFDFSILNDNCKYISGELHIMQCPKNKAYEILEELKQKFTIESKLNKLYGKPCNITFYGER